MSRHQVHLLLCLGWCYPQVSSLPVAERPLSGQPPSIKGTIISVGSIPDLLSLRAMILKSAGYEVVTTSIPQKADFMTGNNHCDVLLLCYSVPDKWRRRLIENFRARFPNGRIVAITNHPVTETPKEVDELVYGVDGPERLLVAIERKAA